MEMKMKTRKDILLNAELNKQAIFDAVGNEVIDIWEIQKRIGLGKNIIKNHLNKLSSLGYIIQVKIQRAGDSKWINVYRQTDKTFTAKTEDELNISDEEREEYTKRFAKDADAMKANPNLRIIRRLDVKLDAPLRKKASSGYKGIGSSFSMWEVA
jgi:predicted transcriptional regulator